MESKTACRMYWYRHCFRGFGFDPVTKEHKVLLMWTIEVWRAVGPSEIHKLCEVLTVGDNTWRTIDECPPFPINRDGDGVYANGSIYWYGRDDDESGSALLVFDIGSEKFRSIRIPGFIRDDCPTEKFKLVGLEAGVAITHRPYKSFHVKMWIFDDHDKKENGTSGTNSNSDKLWSNEVIIKVPYHPTLFSNLPIHFHSIPGTDQIIIEISTRKSKSRKAQGPVELMTLIYSYNWKKNTMRKVNTRGISSSIPFKQYFLNNLWSIDRLWTPFVESFLPVGKKLQHHGNQAK